MAHAEVNFSKTRVRKLGTPKRKGFELRAGGLSIDPVFCPVDIDDPFETVEWDQRTAAIKGENGELLFEQTNCEVPSFWSQLATNVVCSKYFYGENGTPEREYSVRQLIHRVSRTIADWGLRRRLLRHADDGERFYRELDLALPASARRVQLARVVQRRPVSPVRRQRRAVQLALGCETETSSSSRKIRTNIRKARRASFKA